MPLINENGEIAEFLPANKTLANDFDPETTELHFGNLSIIEIEFPSHSDGRGFTIARKLRRMGFLGKLRAKGPLIPDQFANLLACGFNEVEIKDEHLARQPIEQWQAALRSNSASYQDDNGAKLSIIAARHTPSIEKPVGNE